MENHPKSRSALALGLIVGLALLGSPGMGWAEGTGSVISLSQKPGEVISPTAVAVDAAGNLCVADDDRIQRGLRTARGKPAARRCNRQRYVFAFYPHTNDDLLAVGVALDDCTLENGCLLRPAQAHPPS